MEFADVIDPDVNTRIRAVAHALAANMPKGVEEILPTYRSLILVYDPMVTDPDHLIPVLKTVNTDLDNAPLPEPDVVELPVCYHESLAPDLAHVAEVNGLHPDEVIAIHTAPLYPIYMIGFTPGFPYLGGLSQKIHTPRLSTPRTHVPAGSVGIANNQTGIYPIDSPGGWQLIGRTPLRLYNPEATPVTLIQAGVWIRFSPVSSEEYARIEKEVSQGSYVVERREKEESS